MTTLRVDEGDVPPHEAAAQSSGITVCRNPRATCMTGIMDYVPTRTAPSDSLGLGDVNDVDQRVVAALGEPAARELFEILERSDADRAALIGLLDVRENAAWLSELLTFMTEKEV